MDSNASLILLVLCLVGGVLALLYLVPWDGLIHSLYYYVRY